ncbi:uncharacterized protein LOC134856498 [Symsagittifera roscoffensis]|uniref:uncharacterized protein LOC134856498 n=1 Tax=Symsagittifera roscoffensis TaxID=84072 RepID=UPI00307BCF9A
MYNDVISFGFSDTSWSFCEIVLVIFTSISFLPFLLLALYMFLLVAANESNSLGLHGGVQGIFCFYYLRIRALTSSEARQLLDELRMSHALYMQKFDRDLLEIDHVESFVHLSSSRNTRQQNV